VHCKEVDDEVMDHGEGEIAGVQADQVAEEQRLAVEQIVG
jgi:hypothetical protein